MKPTSSLNDAATVKGSAVGGIIDTAASVVTLNLVSLAGSWVTLQAFTYDVDIYFQDTFTAPTTAPVITAAVLGTAAVGRRIVVGQDKDFFIPSDIKSGGYYLVTKALGVGTLRVIPS